MRLSDPRRALKHVQEAFELRLAHGRIEAALEERTRELELMQGVCELQRRRMRQVRHLVRVWGAIAIAAGIHALQSPGFANVALFFLTLSTAAAGGFLFLKMRPRRITRGAS